MSCLLAIDQGTSSSRAVLYDSSVRPLATAQREFEQIYPRPGWVEHDPEAIWQSVREVVAGCIDQAREPIAAIGITNQRETALIWDRATGEPVHNAIVWQCRRTASSCSRGGDRRRTLIRSRSASLRLAVAFSTFPQLVFWVRMAPIRISKLSSAGHQA